MKSSRTRSVLAVGGAVALLALAGCGGGDGNGDAGDSGGDGALAGADLTVGSKEFTESRVLGQITILALENAGAETSDETGISGSATVREALTSDQIDIYWDYTGTGWVNYLGHTTEDVPDDLYQAVADEDKEENGVAWLKPANFENTYRIATTADFAEENGLSTSSDMAEFVNDNPDEGTVCAASEFINRDDGLPGMEDAYGFKFTDVVELDLNLVYPQVGDTCQFGEVFSTDARIVSNDLTVLEDDQGFFVQYEAAATLREDTLEKYPGIADVIAPISEALTGDVITKLNGEVDNDGEKPIDVAQDWLTEQGLLD